MSLRRKLFKFGFLAFLMTSIVGSSANAASLNSNGGSINGQMMEEIGRIIDSTTVDGWHFSGGYWGFNYNDWTESFKINDSDIPTYFTGTSRTFPYTISISKNLPPQVQNFINVYGADKLGITMNLGKAGSVLGDTVSYSISGGKIYLSFRAILRYDRYNMWQHHNPTVWGKMTTKVHTPEVSSGFGENYVSVDGGAVGMKLTPSIMRSAYKADDGTLRFNSTEYTVDGNGTQVRPVDKYALNNFFSGGSNGVYFRFPINIEFRDMRISVNPLLINSHEYYKDNVYWVKAGDPFHLVASSYTPSYDDLVRVNANYFQVNSNGITGYVNARIKEYVDSNHSFNGTSLIGINGGTNTRAGNVLKSDLEARLDGDKDITVSSFGRLIRFPDAGDENFNNEKIYKNSSNSNTLTIKSDSQPPSAKSSTSEYDIKKDSISLNLEDLTDSRSGVKTSTVIAVIYPESDPSKKKNILLDYSGDDFSGKVYFNQNDPYGKYVIEYTASDNVGNSATVKKDIVDRIVPKPVTTKVVIQDYEYEDSTTKWVKADNEFKILQEGYSIVQDPSESHIRISKKDSGIDNTSYSNGYSMTKDKYHSWTTNTKYLVKNRDTYLSLDTRNESSEKRFYGTGNYYYLPKAELNGQKFYVFGTTELEVGGKEFTGEWIRDPKMLGIDAKAPTVNYTADGNKIDLTIEDKESGFNRAEVTIDGKKTTYKDPSFSLNTNSTITVTVYDNVGNSSTTVIEGTKGWEGKYIQTKVDEVNGKKVLKYRVNAQINDYWIDENNNVHVNDHALMFTAQSELYLRQGIVKNTTNYINYSGLIEDKSNVNYGPTLRYDYNNSTYSYIRWDHIEDVEDQVDLKLYKDANPWDSVRKMFASGRKNYKWTLYQTGDRYGNSITKKKVSSGTTVEGQVDVSTFKTGAYEIEVTMYDYNGNPSGTTTLKFNHVQPHEKTDVSDLFLKVTAIKDLNWESMDYPIKYNSLEFPLGKNKLSKNGEGIKLGYAINFSIENLIKHNLSSYSATYTLLGENGEPLTGESNGKSFKDSDKQDNTGYLSQDSSHITLTDDPNTDPTNNGFKSRLFFKHFLPADAEFYTSDGRPYRGKVTVRLKINLKEIGSDGALGDRNYILDLYTIDTTDTAYDDLYIDKQR